MSPAKLHNREAFVSASKGLSIFMPKSADGAAVLLLRFLNSKQNSEIRRIRQWHTTKPVEERKWWLWKEAEEKQLRELGVSEETLTN